MYTLLNIKTNCAQCCVLAAAAGASVRVFALDAAQPWDLEHRMQNKLSKDKQLKIGIVGFGTFGQFLARRMVEAGHRCVKQRLTDIEWVSAAHTIARRRVRAACAVQQQM